MIDKSFDAIGRPDIDALVTNEVREGRTIEYKRDVPGSTDDQKREFLADVSSFANAGGGDLLYGVEAVDAVPHTACGVGANEDAEKLRLESLMRDGLEPRVPGVRIRFIAGFPSGAVVLVRIPRSWVGPHMVTFRNCSRFFSRNSAGKYQMDVSEMRSAFIESQSLPDRIRGWRNERLGRIIAGQAPISMPPAATLVLHIVPTGLSPGVSGLDLAEVCEHLGGLSPIGASGGEHRFNLDGVVTYGRAKRFGEPSCYCQVFRSGQIEAACAHIADVYDEGVFISALPVEQHVLSAAVSYTGVLKALEVQCPLVILVSLLGVAHARLAGLAIEAIDGYTPFDRDCVMLPEVVVEEYTSTRDQQSAAQVLRPVFDALWNASGYARALSYDGTGKWTSGR